MNAPSYFEIQADNVTRASRFYADAFGWKFTKAVGLPVEYWRIETDGLRGGLLQRSAKTLPPEHGTNAFVSSIEVENIDNTAQKLSQLGAKLALPKFAVPGVCWQAYFLDTESNLFGIFQVDPKAK
jgi:predicted enzyme related to lactoylglutathione lyase